MHARKLSLLSSVAFGLFLTSATGALAQDLDCQDSSAQDFGIDGLTITAAEAVSAGKDFAVDHCRIQGVIGQHTGIDGNDYAIGFEIRLPTDWNGSFVHQFNGGNDGRVVPATGSVPMDGGEDALTRGFAVASSDGGHDMSVNRDAGFAGGAVFGLDPTARADYGYSAVAKLHPVALSMVETYYGQAAEYVYGMGSSNGGRHAMVAAARMPDDFDGLFIGYPGYNLPRAAVQHAWDVQALQSVNPEIGQAFPEEDLVLVAEGILAACDALDGLEDGLVMDTTACQAAFNLGSLQCAEGQNEACLSSEQVAALNKMHSGPVDSAGNQLYSDWAWDAGISAGGWRAWKTEGPEAMAFMPRIVALGGPSLAYIFSTPPVEIEGSPEAILEYLASYDFDADAPAIYATTAEFAESAMAFMSPPGSDNPELAEFRDAGGKLIVMHGVSDPVFSYNDTAAWYEKLDANNQGNAEEFALFYGVPGMVHGSGGPSADSHDGFGALIDWVENGEHPGALVTSVAQDNAALSDIAGATRLLCPYPQVSYYTGDDEMSADSFTCR